MSIDDLIEKRTNKNNPSIMGIPQNILVKEFYRDLQNLKQSDKVDVKNKMLKDFTIDRSLLLAFTRERTDLYDKNKEKQFEKEVKGFIENLIDDKLD